MSIYDRLTNGEREAIVALDKPTISEAQIRAQYPGYWHGPAGARADEALRRADAAERRATAAEAEVRRLLSLYPTGVTP